MAEKIKLSSRAFGEAYIPEDGRFATSAKVCAHCAEELAAGLAVTPGLMHVPWQKKDLQKVSQGTLMFMSWEGDRMRAQIFQRVASVHTGKDASPAR
ncbi:MAG: hypothetical protein LLG20_15805 [Acidobacteriales bacterium]|nr:hypothetical protein [Terriglobales bacterium]